jgi:hypothetical protein
MRKCSRCFRTGLGGILRVFGGRDRVQIRVHYIVNWQWPGGSGVFL